ncbi:MAG: 23S rRNA (pseudouridine(1915)-N(3))-methyltransferase RlmH [Terriglobales bacterium]
MKLGLAWVGKTKLPGVAAGTEEYVRRLGGFQRYAAFRVVELGGRDPQAALLRDAASARLWLCDPAGRTFTSPDFARWLERESQAHPQHEILLAIGGADGFSPAVTAAAAGRISLSPLTFSHELARLMALEQLYRALAILTGHPYPH